MVLLHLLVVFFMLLYGNFVCILRCGHFVSLCDQIGSLCVQFVCLCGLFMSLSGLFVLFCVSLWSFCLVGPFSRGVTLHRSQRFGSHQGLGVKFRCEFS